MSVVGISFNKLYSVGDLIINMLFAGILLCSKIRTDRHISTKKYRFCKNDQVANKVLKEIL